MRAKKSNSGLDSRRLKGIDCYCRECHYPLTGLHSPGTCPECGCDFDLTRLLSYSFEPQPASLIERVILRRSTALAAAAGLEIVLLAITTDDGAPAQRSFEGPLVFLIVFLMVGLISFAASPDLFAEGRLHFVLVGSLIGTVAFLPVAWNTGWTALIGGYFFGLFCGIVVYQLKESFR